MIRLSIPQEAIRQFGYEPDEIVTLDLSGCRKFSDIQESTVGESFVLRRSVVSVNDDSFPVINIRPKS